MASDRDDQTTEAVRPPLEVPADRPDRDDESVKLFRYLKAFIVPTIFLKAAIFYFGINYSNDPGAGYGWGLAFAIALSLINFAIFIYLNWQDSDE